MLEAKSLRKALIPPSLIPNPSPGNLQSTRLALLVNGDASSCSVFIASGCRVYKIEVSLDDSVVTKGKESLLIPVQAHVIRSSEVDRCPHRSEIQSVVLAEGDGDNCLVMGTVDSYGHLIVSQLDAVGSDVGRLSYSVLPKDSGVGEGSWAGVCFSPIHWSTAAVARSFCKSIDIYDQDIHLRSLHTLWYPAALSFLGGSITGDGSASVVAVAEGSQLTIWDLRTNHNGGCVQRICGSVGDLIYAVCSSPSGAVAVGGSDRTVTIYDPRRLQAYLFHLQTPLVYTYKVLIMRFSVDSGRKTRKYSHLEETQIGWALVSVQIWIFWLDGVSLVASLWLMCGILNLFKVTRVIISF
ncbi:WD40-repeat-containing domain-containing protein [Dioscorea alata]|uniref:WD40-repeat-containing domain-containing protein n=1 Tax=Dioscorea alata TaxID=55571 RepID=A0ACB7WBX3_DIOAL|nr:WD40-repeat-containing domain-containing protein [Dioscorea alata]